MGEELLEEDEEADEESSPDPDFEMKRFAIARVHLLGYIQQMLIEEENPPPSDFDAPWMPSEDSPE